MMLSLGIPPQGTSIGQGFSERTPYTAPVSCPFTVPPPSEGGCGVASPIPTPCCRCRWAASDPVARSTPHSGKFSHPFSAPTDNWTITQFGAHICWHDTRFLIFCNGQTIIELFLYKSESNLKVFNSSSKSFSLININATSIIFPMYCWCTTVKCQGLHSSPDSLSFIGSLLHAYDLSISGVRGYSCLNLYFPEDSNPKQSIQNT